MNANDNSCNEFLVKPRGCNFDQSGSVRGVGGY